jgi:outer membrane immunogenic protein
VAPVAVAPVAVAPAYISEWAGFYVGIHVGGARGHTSIDPGEFEGGDVDTGLASIPFTFPSQSSSGGVFGFQLGHNWQWGSVVGGLEIDFSGANIKGSSNFAEVERGLLQNFNQEVKIDELASARGRLGYLIYSNWLLYSTAGIGWGHTRFNLNQFVVVAPAFSETNTTFSNEFGWVAGVGLEWKLADRWLLRGEWLHYNFGSVTHPNLVAPQNGLDEDNFTFRTTVDVARAALSYKF